jgi:hypothetical protein
MVEKAGKKTSWNDRIKFKQEAIIHNVLERFSSNPRRLINAEAY